MSSATRLVIASALMIVIACSGCGGTSDADSRKPVTTSSVSSASAEPPALESLATPSPREPVVLNAEYAPLFRSNPGAFEELTFPLLANVRSILLELYANGADPSAVDFSSVTDDRYVKQELRLTAEELIAIAPKALDVKFCLDGATANRYQAFGDYLDDTSWWADCGTFGTSLNFLEVGDLKSLFALRTATPEDPDSELSENTREYTLGSRLIIGDDDTLRLYKGSS